MYVYAAVDLKVDRAGDRSGANGRYDGLKSLQGNFHK